MLQGEAGGDGGGSLQTVARLARRMEQAEGPLSPARGDSKALAVEMQQAGTAGLRALSLFPATEGFQAAPRLRSGRRGKAR